MEELYGSPSLAFAEAAYSMEAQSVVENMLSSNGNFPSQVAVFSEHMFGSSGQLMSGSSGISDADSMVGEIKKGGSEEEVSSAIRAKIASHPLYPKLLQAYIDCQKVGAPPEIVKMLDDIGGESSVLEGNAMACLGADPELDHFMETYCEMLAKYKSDLSKPFDEATMFLNNIKAQLSHICNGCCEEEDISGEMESVNEEHDLKEKLMQKYSGYISSLKHEFSKKKKNGKLPKEAIQILLDWWNVHYKWPYPMEADKVSLAEATGLDQKQINNWFINQRKRHWRPSENMQIAVMDSLYEPFCLFTNDP